MFCFCCGRILDSRARLFKNYIAGRPVILPFFSTKISIWTCWDVFVFPTKDRNAEILSGTLNNHFCGYWMRGLFMNIRDQDHWCKITPWCVKRTDESVTRVDIIGFFDIHWSKVILDRELTLWQLTSVACQFHSDIFVVSLAAAFGMSRNAHK